MSTTDMALRREDSPALGYRSFVAEVSPPTRASLLQASLWWDDTPVQLATWSPAHQEPPWWLELARAPHLTVRLEPVEQTPLATRWRPSRDATLALLGTLLAHLAVLVAMYTAHPRLAPPTDEDTDARQNQLGVVPERSARRGCGARRGPSRRFGLWPGVSKR